MRDRVIFGASSVFVSFVLYGGASYAQLQHYYVPASVGFLVAALAVIVCALGASWGRKAVFAGGLLGAFVMFDLGMTAVGLGSAGTGAGSAAVRVGPAAALFLAAVPLVLPLAALAAFVGQDPSMLWTANATPARGKSRPR
jgi:hypothetical protein